MDIKIYIDGKLDWKHELVWNSKKAAWATFVAADVVLRNKRLFYTSDEKKAIHGQIMAFASGDRHLF